MEFNVHWFNGFHNYYSGRIHDDVFARGDTQRTPGYVRNNWTSQSKFECVSAAPAPFEPPPGVVQLPKDPGAVVADPPAEQTPAKPSVTVLQDSNVYDAPEGNRIGGDNFFLNDGEKYDLVAPCANDWCHLVIPAVPGGKGFVFRGNEQEGFFLKVN